MSFILLIAFIAFLYASVGHGGASGYLALMIIFGISPVLTKSSALILNIFVSIISFWQFYQAGHFRWKLFFPFVIGSIPMSFLGGFINVSDDLYKQLLGLCLLFAVFRILHKPLEVIEKKQISWFWSLLIGGGIGLFSGMLGIGGGIILTPVLLFFAWVNIKEAAAISSLFIFFNSLAGLAGLTIKGFQFDYQVITWVGAGVLGGFLGAYYGSQKFNSPTLRYILASVLLIACWKLLSV